MNRLASTTIALAVALAASGAAAAAHAAPLDAIVGRLAPHKAIYELELATLGLTSGVADVHGAIYYEFGETCDGWAVKHKFLLAITRAQKREVVTLTDFSSTESKDGLGFTFVSATRTNGKVTSETKGRAVLERLGGPGFVRMEKPKAERVPLPAGTMFPTWHSIAILGAAESGKKRLWATIFDASNDANHSGVNTLIGAAAKGPSGVPAPSRAAGLVDDPGWRIRIAYFDAKKDDGKPNYRLKLRLNGNGVTPRILLDYGDFTLRARLRAIEALPKPVCQQSAR